MSSSILFNGLIFLGAALVFVPIAKKLGIGSVLGYLIAGIIIGPFVIGLVGKEGEDIMHAAEFGVVMMLFLIGLELNPQSFWRMRRSIVGMGLSQMLITAALLFVVFFVGLHYSIPASIAIALSLSMSSTAIVLQTLKEKGLNKTESGVSSFAVLLFQDIAVIPILAILPLLAAGRAHADREPHGHESFIDGLSAPMATLAIFGAMLVIFFSGRFLIDPFLRLIARVRMRELFTAAALFLVISVAWLMEQVGISAALGTFMAGVLLANSEFRHELESDVEPFKGVLLGLFFTAVGSTINFGLIVAEPLRILAFVLLIMAIKALVLAGIARSFKLKTDQGILFALLLSQVGEFAFVLLASSRQLEILSAESLDLLMVTITISMMFSPVFLFLNERFIEPRFGVQEAVPEKAADAIHEENSVIIAGFGHFGSTVGRFLRANGVHATILDNDSDRVELLRKMGFKVFYGDATRLQLLESAGAASARAFISAIDSPEKNQELVDMIQKHFPHLKLFIRAKNRFDAYELLDRGLEHIYRESLHSSVYLGVEVLGELGHRKYTATRKAAEFIKYDDAALKKLAKGRHEAETYIVSVREEIALQEKLLSEDMNFSDQRTDGAWDGAPRRTDY